jgi:hypothetical protein
MKQMITYKRGKGKYNSDYKAKDFYAFYVTNVSDPLPNKLFRAIFKDFAEAIMLEIIYNGYELNLPAKMGSILIMEMPYEFRLTENGEVDKSRLIPDWKKTKLKWMKLYPDKTPEEISEIKDKPIVYLENEHSDETIKRWYWDKISCNFRYQNIYRFNATRAWDRVLANANKQKNISYKVKRF